MALTPRQQAGKKNWKNRRPWSAEDRERQRQNCLRQQPWRHSTGLRTPEGREQSRINGYQHVANPDSARQLRQSVRAETDAMISVMAEMRHYVAQ